MGKVLYPKCCFCNTELKGFGNDPSPLSQSGRCCDSCNLQYVTLARYLLLQSKADEQDAEQILKLIKDKMTAEIAEAKAKAKDREEFAKSETSHDDPQ